MEIACAFAVLISAVVLVSDSYRPSSLLAAAAISRAEKVRKDIPDYWGVSRREIRDRTRITPEAPAERTK